MSPVIVEKIRDAERKLNASTKVGPTLYPTKVKKVELNLSKPEPTVTFTMPEWIKPSSFWS